MPTLARADVARAAALLLAAMERHGPGCVVAYAELAEQLREDIGQGKAHRKHLHLLRAAAEELRS